MAAVTAGQRDRAMTMIATMVRARATSRATISHVLLPTAANG